MAITITAPAGSASANSYLTLSDANAIIEGLVLDDDVAAWDNSTTDNKNRALYTATVRIDREDFLEQEQQIRRLYNGREQESESQILM